MSILVALIAAFVAVPWLIICLAPILLLLITAALPLMGLVLLFKKDAIIPALEPAARPKWLVVDDDFASVLPLINLLEKGCGDINFVASGEEMLRELSATSYDMIFLDSKMPNMTGEDALQKGDESLNLNRKQPVIFFSGDASHIRMPWDLRHFEVRDIWNKGDLLALQHNISAVFATTSTSVA